MKNLVKYFSRRVPFPKWVFSFDIRISFTRRTYAALLEYGAQTEFKDEFDSPAAAQLWAENRVKWIYAEFEEGAVATYVETTAGEWKEFDSEGFYLNESVVAFHFEPR